jgi:hypothetical protein
MAAAGQKLELGLIRQVVGNVGANLRSPAMYEQSPGEDERQRAEPLETRGSSPRWFDLREGVRGWGFLIAFGVSLYLTFKLLMWLISVLFH